MAKIVGLDELTKTLKQAQRGISELIVTVGAVHFDPHDPASIEAAIQQANDLVDSKIGTYSSNPLIAPLAKASKEQFRSSIIERAAAARLRGGNGDESH